MGRTATVPESQPRTPGHAAGQRSTPRPLRSASSSFRSSFRCRPTRRTPPLSHRIAISGLVPADGSATTCARLRLNAGHLDGGRLEVVGEPRSPGSTVGDPPRAGQHSGPPVPRPGSSRRRARRATPRPQQPRTRPVVGPPARQGRPTSCPRRRAASRRERRRAQVPPFDKYAVIPVAPERVAARRGREPGGRGATLDHRQDDPPPDSPAPSSRHPAGSTLSKSAAFGSSNPAARDDSPRAAAAGWWAGSSRPSRGVSATPGLPCPKYSCRRAHNTALTGGGAEAPRDRVAKSRRFRGRAGHRPPGSPPSAVGCPTRFRRCKAVPRSPYRQCASYGRPW